LYGRYYYVFVGKKTRPSFVDEISEFVVVTVIDTASITRNKTSRNQLVAVGGRRRETKRLYEYGARTTRRNGQTGQLERVVNEGAFFQELEGDRPVVKSLTDRKRYPCVWMSAARRKVSASN